MCNILWKARVCTDHVPSYSPWCFGSERPKILWTYQFLTLLTSTCAQQCALFRRLNFKKLSKPVNLSALSAWKCTSRCNGVQLFISHLARWLRTRRFSEPTFSTPQSHKYKYNTNHGKTQCFMTPLPFRTPVACIFFLLAILFCLLFPFLLWLLTLLTSAFHVCILSEDWL